MKVQLKPNSPLFPVEEQLDVAGGDVFPSLWNAINYCTSDDVSFPLTSFSKHCVLINVEAEASSFVEKAATDSGAKRQSFSNIILLT